MKTGATYSYRRASIGERREARMAGAMPNIIPTATENPKARNIDKGVTSETKNRAKIKDAPIPSTMPIIPPLTDKNTASSRNCFNISFLLAPKAFRRPISRVLSVTEDDFTIQTASSSLEIVTNVTNILSLALGGIAAISLLVGGIGVANIMLVSVTERTREIGLRKALVARRNDILKQFLLEAVFLSVSGGIIGIVLGIGASLILARFFVSVVTPWSIFLAFGFSVAVGIIFGMAPAIRASRLSPIEALRYE